MRYSTALPGVVWALGHEAAAAAEEYGALTGRPIQQCNSVYELHTSSSDVVVCTTAHLTAPLLEGLSQDRAGRGVPGLMCARNSSELVEVCRRQATKLAPRPIIPRRVFVYAGLDFTIIERKTDIFIGGAVAADELRRVLSSDASILAVCSHSDGIDLRLSFSQIACPFLDSSTNENQELLPPCKVLDQCIRFPVRPTMSAASNAGWIVPLGMLKAQAAIINACHVVRLSDGVIDPSYGLAASLLRQSDLGVIVTTWRKELGASDGSHLNPLINDLCNGTSVGLAVGAFNASLLARHAGINLCVVGDPCFAIEPHPGFAHLPVIPMPERRSTSTEQKQSAGAEAALLRDAVINAMRSNPAFDTAKGTALVSSLSAWQAQSAAGLSSNQSLDCLAIDPLLIDFLTAAPWLSQFFAPFGSPEGGSQNDFCRCCLTPARALNMTFPQYGTSPRLLTSCPYCDESSNLPSGWNVALDLSKSAEGLISVTGAAADAHVTVAFYHLWGDLCEAYDWSSPGRERIPFRMPASLPLLPLYCQVIVAYRLQVGNVCFWIRRLSDGAFVTTHGAKPLIAPLKFDSGAMPGCASARM